MKEKKNFWKIVSTFVKEQGWSIVIMSTENVFHIVTWKLTLINNALNIRQKEENKK